METRKLDCIVEEAARALIAKRFRWVLSSEHSANIRQASRHPPLSVFDGSKLKLEDCIESKAQKLKRERELGCERSALYNFNKHLALLEAQLLAQKKDR